MPVWPTGADAGLERLCFFAVGGSAMASELLPATGFLPFTFSVSQTCSPAKSTVRIGLLGDCVRLIVRRKRGGCDFVPAATVRRRTDGDRPPRRFYSTDVRTKKESREVPTHFSEIYNCL